MQDLRKFGFYELKLSNTLRRAKQRQRIGNRNSTLNSLETNQSALVKFIRGLVKLSTTKVHIKTYNTQQILAHIDGNKSWLTANTFTD